MAARKLVGSISRPANTIFLQRPPKPHIINPVHRFLLKSPKPKRPNPHHVLGFRSPATKSRPFSTESEIESCPHWSMEYRRRLGIDDGDLVLFQPHFAFWRPPRDGEIKINFCGTLLPDHYDPDEDDHYDQDEIKINFCGTLLPDHYDHDEDDHYDHDEDVEQRGYIKHEDVTGSITAIARNSAGDARGVTAGAKEFKHVSRVGMQLYALKAAVNLANELKITGIHDGPVVYESASRALASGLWESEEVIIRNMPRCEDLDEFGRLFPIFCGTKEKLEEIMPFDLHMIFGFALHMEKIHAGLD